MLVGSDAVWYQDVRVLLRRPDEFWPAADQTPEERLNSMVRLVAYCAVAVYAYARNPNHLALAALAIALVSLAHRGVADERDARAPATRDRGCAHVAGRRGVVAEAADDQFLPRKDRACTRSTPDNPFANFMVSDYASNPGRPAACKYDQHKDEIEANFNRGLVRNAYDIYDKENSQRQFVTMPVTRSAPDTIAFAQFAYGGMGKKTCKEDPSLCRGAFP